MRLYLKLSAFSAVRFVLVPTTGRAVFHLWLLMLRKLTMLMRRRASERAFPRRAWERVKYEKVRAFEVGPAPLKDSRGISKARGGRVAPHV